MAGKEEGGLAKRTGKKCLIAVSCLSRMPITTLDALQSSRMALSTLRRPLVSPSVRRHRRAVDGLEVWTETRLKRQCRRKQEAGTCRPSRVFDARVQRLPRAPGGVDGASCWTKEGRGCFESVPVVPRSSEESVG